MSTATRTRRINIYINGKQVSNDIKSITAEMRNLSNQTRLLDRNSLQYVTNMRQIRYLNSLLAEHNAALRATSTSLFTLKGLANAYNKYWPVVMTGIGAMAGLIFSVKNVTDEFAKFEDKIADVMKTTGLTRDEVLNLNESFKKINTRTAQSELMDLAYVAGKLGITTEKDILAFVRASDKIVVALQKDLGGSAEDAVNALGKLVQVFNLKEEFGIEESLLKVGSAINELGMASAANEQNIVSFTRRAAGIGKLAGVSVPNLLAVGASMDALAVSTEVGATAYIMFMGAMAKKTDVFANLVGMKIEEFTELLNTDANEAFLKVLETLGSSADGFSGLAEAMGDAGMDGQRAVAVISTLAQQTGFLRDQQELSTNAFMLGTSIIDEFNIKNNTAQAIIDKNTKVLSNLRIELGEQLLPTYISAQNVLVSFIKNIATLIRFIGQHSDQILHATAVIIGYKISLIAFTLATGTATAGTMAFTIATTYNRIAMALSVMGLKLYIGVWKLYHTIIEIARTKTLTFAAAMTLVKGVMTGFATFLVYLASSAYFYEKSMRSATKETINLADEIARLTKEKQDSVIKEKINIKTLTGVILGLNEKSMLRVKLIKELKEAYPDLLGFIDADKISNDELSIALEAVNTNITNRIKIMAMEAKAEAIKNKMVENAMLMLDVEDRRNKAQEEFNKARAEGYNMDEKGLANKMAEFDQEYQAIAKQNELMEDDYRQLFNYIGSEKGLLTIHQIEELERQRDEVTAQIELEKKMREEGAFVNDGKLESLLRQKVALDQKLNVIEKINKAEDEFSVVNELQAQKEELKRYNKGEVDKFTHEQNIRNIELKFMQGRLLNWQYQAEDKLKLENDIEKKIAEIREAYDKQDDKKEAYKLKKDWEFKLKSTQLLKDFLAGKIETEREYKELLLQLEIETLTDQLKNLKETDKEYVQIDAQLQDKLLEQLNTRLDYEAALRDAAGVDEIEQTREKYTKLLKKLGLFGKDVEKMTIDQQKAYAGIARNQQDELNKIDAERIKNHFEALSESYLMQLSEMKLRHTEQLNELGNDKKARQKLKAEQSKEEIELVKTHYTKIKDLIDELKRNGSIDGLNLSDLNLSEQELAELTAILTKWANEIAGVKEKFTNDLGVGNVDLFGFSTSEWDQFITNIDDSWATLDFETKFETIAMGLQAISNLSADYFKLMAAYEDRAIKRAEEKNNAEKDALQKRLDFGLISQENYNAQVEKMDLELDRKKAIIERKQAAREKALAIFNATINGAVAVVRTLHKPVLAAIIAGMVALQIGMIAATPLPDIPGAEAGGQLIQRTQDGKKFNAKIQPGKRGYVSSPTVITGENGLEYIVPNQAMNNPTIRPILESLEMARLNNNLATVDFNDLLYSQIYNGRQAGGFNSINTTSSIKPTSDTGNNELFASLMDHLKMNSEAIKQLNKKLETPFTGYVSLYGPKGFLKAMDDDKQIKNNANI